MDASVERIDRAPGVIRPGNGRQWALPCIRPARPGDAEPQPAAPEEPPDVTRDVRSFTAAIRTRIFAFLRAWAIARDEAALEVVGSPHDPDEESWTPARLREARERHRVEHGGLRLDPAARNLRHTHVEPSAERGSWRVEQMLIDTEDVNDWILVLDVDLDASRAAGEPVLRLRRLGSLV